MGGSNVPQVRGNANMALYLGAILGGPELLDKDFDRAVSRICARKDYWQSKLVQPTDAALNVVFRYPGTISQPDFVGMRVGRFIKKENRLEILVAVPREVLLSDTFSQHYGSLLKEAIAEGKKVFEKRGIPFSLEDHLALADKSLENVTTTETGGL
jgi:hypothetical protein